MKNLKKYKVKPAPVFDSTNGKKLKEWCTIRIWTTDQSRRYVGSGRAMVGTYKIVTSPKNFKKIMARMEEIIY